MKPSAKARARRDRINAAMSDWRRARGPEGQYCFNCGVMEGAAFLGLSTHHIIRRSRSRKLADDLRNFIMLCHYCHSKAEHRIISLRDQLRLKETHDPSNYDPDVILEYVR